MTLDCGDWRQKQVYLLLNQIPSLLYKASVKRFFLHKVFKYAPKHERTDYSRCHSSIIMISTQVLSDKRHAWIQAVHNFNCRVKIDWLWKDTQKMTTSFTFAILAWVFLRVSAATGDSCSLAESPRVLPYRYQELKGSSCPNQSKRSVRIKCMVFCPRHTQKQLNDSTKQDGLLEVNPPTEEKTTVTKTEQE